MLVTSVGEVYGWGSARCGSLGLDFEVLQHDKDGTVYKGVPTRVESLRGRKIKQVACGAFHTLALTEEGKVMAWGHGSYGALGLAEMGELPNESAEPDAKRFQATPRLVSGLPSHVLSIAAGESISMAVAAAEVDQTECLIHAMSRLHASADFSDCVFEVESRLIRAHKCVLAARSQYYHDMFAVDKFAEAAHANVVVADFSYDVFQKVLHWIYTGRLPQSLLEADSMEMLKCADKYLLDELKEAIADWLHAHLSI